MAIFVPRFLRQQRDVDTSGAAVGDVLTLDGDGETWVGAAGAGGGVTDHGALTGLADNDHPQYQLAATAATDAELAAMLDQAVILAPATVGRNRIVPVGGIATGNRVLLDSGDEYVDVLESGAAFPWLISAPLVGRLKKTLTANAAVSTHEAGVLGFLSTADAFRHGYLAGLEGLAFYNGSYAAGNAFHELVGVRGWAQDIDQDYTTAATGQFNHLRGGSFEVTRGGSGPANDATGVFTRVIVDGQTFPNLGQTQRITGYEIDTTVFGDPANAQHLALYGIYLVHTYNGPQNIVTAYGIRFVSNYGAAGVGTSYGIYLAAQGGADTASYAIYAAGGKSVFVDGIVIRLLAAPADAAFANGEGGWWWDQANSLPKWKGKKSDGTVVNFTPSSGGAPTTATYITQTSDAGLSAEQALSALATGLVKNTTGTGVLSIGAQGADYYAPGGTDVAVADGGTGASTAVAARTNLQAHPYRKAGYKVGEYFPGECIPNQGGTGVNNLDRCMFIPFFVDVTTTFDRIAIYITANSGAGGVQRMGIYNDNSGVPGTVLLDAGTVAVDAGAAAIKAITISQQLTPGRYWLCSVAQTAAPTVKRALFGGPLAWLNTTFDSQGMFLDGVTGALGNNPAVVVGGVNPTTVALRALSSP